MPISLTCIFLLEWYYQWQPFNQNMIPAATYNASLVFLPQLYGFLVFFRHKILIKILIGHQHINYMLL